MLQSNDLNLSNVLCEEDAEAPLIISCNISEYALVSKIEDKTYSMIDLVCA